jgi:hypothetical protein
MTVRQFVATFCIVFSVGYWAGCTWAWFQMLHHSRSRPGVAWSRTVHDLTPTGRRFWRQGCILWIAAVATGGLGMLRLSGA